MTKTIGCLILMPAALLAQYTSQRLLPPVDQPSLTITTAYALNNMGQVYGRAIAPGGGPRAPVLWTGGVGTTLPIPSGYHWYDSNSLAINDSGTVAALVQNNLDTNNDAAALRIVVWTKGTASLLPAPPQCQGVSELGLSNSVLGLNRAGHILGASAGGAAPAANCSLYWIWNGAGFEAIPQPQPVQGCIGFGYIINPGPTNHLNDADHVAMDRYWAVNVGCPIQPPENPMILIPPATVTILGSLNTSSGQINNRDQVLAALSGSGNHLYFWDGGQYHDLGVSEGYLNNAGQVGFINLANGPPQINIFQNGSVSTIEPPAGLFDPHIVPGIAGFNDAGQIAVNPGGAGYLLTPAGACAQDVSSLVQVTRGGFRLNRTNQHFTQLITVTNTSALSISGPISIALDGVPTAASLFGVAGATACNQPQGSPFLNAQAVSLAPGASTTATLEFIDTAGAGIAYSTRVLAGPGGR